jgi:hypothetical protein
LRDPREVFGLSGLAEGAGPPVWLRLALAVFYLLGHALLGGGLSLLAAVLVFAFSPKSGAGLIAGIGTAALIFLVFLTKGAVAARWVWRGSEGTR